MGSLTYLAVRPGELTVQVDDIGTSGSLVKIVDILREESEPWNEATQGRHRTMRGIWLSSQHLHAAPLIPPPYELRIALECFQCREL